MGLVWLTPLALPGAAPALLSHKTKYLVPDVLAQALALVQGDPSNQLHA